ncbi:MAG: DNA repair protein RecO [Patescibacteria group bacterium]
MIKTQAIILKKAGSNEKDQLLTIYSEELGKIFISAKGTKKLESKLRYSIEPISFVQLILVEGKNFLILKDAFLIDQFLNIKKDLEKLKKANQLNDLINNAFPEQEKDQDVWKLILKTFKDLDKKVINIKEFEKDLIQLLGYDKDMDLKDIY